MAGLFLAALIASSATAAPASHSHTATKSASHAKAKPAAKAKSASHTAKRPASHAAKAKARPASHAAKAKPASPYAPRAYSAIVIDAQSGQVLRSDNAQSPRYPASLTKMMTLYLTFDALRRGALKLDQTLPVSAHAAAQSPTKIGVRAGQRLLVRDAILALVTQSANDASVVLAEAMGGTEAGFAARMTAKARELGMINTTYRNASGLPNPQQVTTAADYALLSRALMRDFPQDYAYFSTRSFTWNGRTFGNHNHLLEKYEGTDGIKTGYTNASGFNLAASTQRGGRRLIAVVFGGQSAAARDRQVMALLDSGFADLGIAPAVLVAQKQNRAGTKTAAARPAPVRVASTGSTKTNAAARHTRSLEAAVKGAIVSPAEAAEAPAAPKKAARPKVAKAEAAATPGSWGVQVGAFTKRSSAELRAEHAVRRAPTTLGSAQRTIAKVRTSDGNAAYRVRFLGLSEQNARSTCAKLKPAKIGCLPVPPRQVVAVN